MSLHGMEGLEGCSQWNFMPGLGARLWQMGLAAGRRRSSLAFTGTPSRRCFSFRYRRATGVVSADIRNRLVDRARGLGFPVDDLILVDHAKPDCAPGQPPAK